MYGCSGVRGLTFFFFFSFFILLRDGRCLHSVVQQPWKCLPYCCSHQPSASSFLQLPGRSGTPSLLRRRLRSTNVLLAPDPIFCHGFSFWGITGDLRVDAALPVGVAVFENASGEFSLHAEACFTVVTAALRTRCSMLQHYSSTSVCARYIVHKRESNLNSAYCHIIVLLLYSTYCNMLLTHFQYVVLLLGT